MATIIRAADAHNCQRMATIDFDDVAARAEQHLAKVRSEAAHIVARAESEAEEIRLQAAEAGRHEAEREMDEAVVRRVAPALTALDRAAAELKQARQEWLAHWETAAVRLSAAMAERIARRELRQRPEITLSLVREALELAVGSPDVRLRLNPRDYQSLGVESRRIAESMAAIGRPEVIADESVSPGGCKVDTRFGSIDQQIESQLNRILKELLGEE